MLAHRRQLQILIIVSTSQHQTILPLCQDWFSGNHVRREPGASRLLSSSPPFVHLNNRSWSPLCTDVVAALSPKTKSVSMDAATDLETWQEAFEKHPISTTRAIEKQLRSSVANNRERLRILVGGNYRELLSTAEQIATLDTQTKVVESHISEIGQQCQPPIQHRPNSSNVSRKRLVASLRTLQRFTDVTKSSITDKDWLQSARLIVISRLLIKSLSDHQTSLSMFPSLREKTASLRRQILRHIDITLSSVHSTNAEVVAPSCAYCLITSASFQDVMRHILRLRIEKLRKLLNHEHLLDRHIIGALRYYVTSLSLVSGLNGRTMIDALGNLQKRPILQEPALLEIELINLKQVKSLIPDDIVSFTPYLNRTPFSGQELRDILQEWASNASSLVSQSLQRLLEGFTSLTKVLDIRQSLYSVLLPVYFSIPGIISMHQVVHDVLSKRIEAIYLSKMDELREIAGSKSLPTRSDPETGSLWQEDLAKMSLKDGAPNFLRQVHRRRRGTSVSLARTSRALTTWISSIKAMQVAFQALGSIRWRDMLEEPDDEQEAEADQVIQMLVKDDPELYLSHMNAALLAGFESLEDNLIERVNVALGQEADAAVAVGHLRTIRELVAPLRQAFPDETKFHKLGEVIPRLHETIAEDVLRRVNISSEADNDRPVAQSALLENLPSPRTFRFLRRLCAAMFEVGGTDVWSLNAVKVLKIAAVKQVFHQERKRYYIKTAFDEQYLAIALDSVQPTSESLNGQQKAAKEYWHRTKLLFGVLSG